MTIKVYEVNGDGVTTRVVREKAEVAPLVAPEPSHRFPACTCPQCQEAGQ